MSTSYSVSSFLSSSDGITRTLFGLLLLMSIASWVVILLKAYQQNKDKKQSKVFLEHFWASSNFEDVERSVKNDPGSSYAFLTKKGIEAQKHHFAHRTHTLADSGSDEDYLTRALRYTLDDEMTRQESGMTLLATVGSTAPFVGLFGTVWGVYHALISIGSSSASTIDKVAGPVGEALIMTGFGLAVAIPAVVAYNIFSRRIKVWSTHIEGFAFELLSFLTMGYAIGQTKSNH